MELLDFYRALLPASGLYALFSVPLKRHIFVDSLDLLVALTNRVVGEADWYYAVGAFSEKERTQASCRAKRCFYLDIDAGAKKFDRDPDGAYPGQRDALVGLSQFIKSTGLVPTFIVSSGAGLHVYYALDADVPPAEWQPVAKALGAFAASQGLKVDSSCTTDSARVLRPLGALHNNGNRVALIGRQGKTWNLNEFAAKLPAPEPVLVAPTRAKLKVNADVQMWEPTPTSAFKVAEKCAALREVAAAKGDVPEPFWRAMLGVVKFSTEGLDAAHEWSRGYDGYDPDETEAKFNRYAGTGPTTCESFGRLTKACQGCEHRGKITSPMQLGRMTAEQVEALPEEKRPAPLPKPEVPEELPFAHVEWGEGYRAIQVGGKWQMQGRKLVEKETDEGTDRSYVWVKFYDDVLWLEGWTDAGRQISDGAMVNLIAWTNSSGQIRSWEFATANLSSGSDLFKALGALAITKASIDNTVSTMMHNYINSQFIRAKGTLSRLAVRERFGLQFEGDGPTAKLVCAHGDYVIRGDGSIERAVLGAKLVAYRHTFAIADLPESKDGRWDGLVWAKHIIPGARRQVDFYQKYYTRPGYEVAQLAVMMSLASPLLIFAADSRMSPGASLPPIGLTVSLYSSSSGQGKTAMQKAIASAYGDPALLVLAGSSGDATPAFQAARAAIMGTMPYFLDEVTQNTKEEVGALINKLANGSNKGRADRAGNARDVATWALVGSVSTNIPQREMLAAFQKSSDALQMRLIELTCEFPRIEKDGHVQFERDRDEMLAKHYGALGAIVNYLVVRNGPERMREMVQGRFEEASKLVPGSSQRERFLQRGMAVVLACHDFLSAIGLGLFDRSTLIDQYARAAKDAVSYAMSLSRSPDDVLRKMVSDLAPNIIVTQSEAWGRMETRLDMVTNRQQLKTPYAGRRVEGGHYLHLMCDVMRQWCMDNQVSFSEIVQFAQRNDFLKPEDGEYMRRVKITRGTDLSAVHGQCVTIDEALLFPEYGVADSSDRVVDLTAKENGNAVSPARSGRLA